MPGHLTGRDTEGPGQAPPGAVQRGAARAQAVVLEDDEQALAGFYELLVNVARLKHYPIREVGYYQALFREYRTPGRLMLLVARVGDALAGRLLAIRLGRRHARGRVGLAQGARA